jgi:hypothetical protein
MYLNGAPGVDVTGDQNVPVAPLDYGYVVPASVSTSTPEPIQRDRLGDMTSFAYLLSTLRTLFGG